MRDYSTARPLKKAHDFSERLRLLLPWPRYPAVVPPSALSAPARSSGSGDSNSW